MIEKNMSGRVSPSYGPSLLFEAALHLTGNSVAQLGRCTGRRPLRYRAPDCVIIASRSAPVRGRPFRRPGNRVYMAKTRTLRGAAHDVVDHCMSALGWLHPHVWEYANSRNLRVVGIDLIGTPPLHGTRIPKPLRLASESLQQWFKSLLASYGFSLQDLRAAEVTFGAFGTDPHSPAATCVIVSVSGREFRYDRGWPPNSPLQPTATAPQSS